MTTTRSLTTVGATAGGSSGDAATRRPAAWAHRYRRVLIAGAVATAVVALAVSQNWIAAGNVLPLLFALPCALMMLKCMSGMNRSQPTETARALGRSETPSAPDRS